MKVTYMKIRYWDELDGSGHD